MNGTGDISKTVDTAYNRSLPLDPIAENLALSRQLKDHVQKLGATLRDSFKYGPAAGPRLVTGVIRLVQDPFWTVFGELSLPPVSVRRAVTIKVRALGKYYGVTWKERLVRVRSVGIVDGDVNRDPANPA